MKQSLNITGIGTVILDSEEQLKECLGFMKAVAAPEHRALDGTGEKYRAYQGARVLAYYSWRQACVETDSNID